MSPSTLAWSQIGANDLQAYYNAYQLLAAGINPYDPASLAQLPAHSGATLVFNPPWLFLMLSPLFQFGFETARYLMLTANLVLLILAAFLSWRLQTDKKALWLPLTISAVFFCPALSCIALGQISLLLTCFFLAAAYCYQRQYFFLCGVLISLTSIKPPAIYLGLLFLGFLVLKERRWNVIVGTLFGLLVLGTVTFLYQAQALEWWLTQPKLFLDYKAASFVTVVRELFSSEMNPAPRWPIFVIPAATATIVSFWVLFKKQLSTEYLGLLLAPLLCLSALTSPYLYQFDQSITLAAHIGLLAFLVQRAASPLAIKRALYALCLGQLVVLISSLWLPYQHQLFWAPLISLIIWSSSERLFLKSARS